MGQRLTDIRYWVVFGALAVVLLMACSSDDSTGSGPGSSSGSPVESGTGSMTQG